ncbi:MAG: hypothetical protein LBR74_05605 [Eubacterium sp.]|nr:hypothetical protein [Eubacterium sp.]
MLWVCLLFGIIAIIVVVLIIVYIIFVISSTKRITGFFTYNKKSRSIHQSVNSDGRSAIKMLKDKMCGLKISDRLRIIGEFFNYQTLELFWILAKRGHISFFTRTHLSIRLKTEQDNGIVVYKKIAENDDNPEFVKALKRHGFSETYDTFLRKLANYKRASLELKIKRTGRPLRELISFIGKRDFNTALFCKREERGERGCCGDCSKNIKKCKKSNCPNYVWREFAFYHIELNVEEFIKFCKKIMLFGALSGGNFQEYIMSNMDVYIEDIRRTNYKT